MRIVVGISVMIALVVAACSGSAGGGDLDSASAVTPATSGVPSTDAPQITAPPTTTTTAAPPTSTPQTSTTTLVVPDQLTGWPVQEIVLDGAALQVAVAATPVRRQQGLMNVDDLGDLDGMLFVWPEDTTTSFWMEDTMIPLDIAFFSANGGLVGLRQMEPCVEDPCPLYTIDEPYRYALEAPAGRLVELRDGARLEYTPAA